MGSARGSFTGALDRQGRILQARGGTLFLDELGDLALGNQIALLRFLQDRRLEPVGGRVSEPVDVRIIAATNRPLEVLIADGSFREDLFHRFAPPLSVPPLRDRRDEILPLARRWLRSRSRAAGVEEPHLAEDAAERLLAYDWPGNVRQLEALLSHALLLAKEEGISRELVESLLPGEAEPRGAPTSWEEWRRMRDDQERNWLRSLLARHDGRVTPAARAIGCPLTTLRDLVRRHGLVE